MTVGPELTFVGDAIDDLATLRRVSAPHAALLKRRNGYIAFRGGLHIRGAVISPSWHSLHAAWDGDQSLHQRYPAVHETDVPFGEDCVGDQFLLRNDLVVQLMAETGEIERTDLTLDQFIATCESDPIEFLVMHPLLQLESEGISLKPGELVHAYPPFCSNEAANGVSLAAVPSAELLEFHSQLARTIGPLKDGDRIVVRVE